MSNRRELLEKLTNISEECSDIESDATNSELSSENEADYIHSETSDTEDSDEESITNDENESAINRPRKRCRVLSSSDSDEETEHTFQETETAADGTVWSKFDEGGIPGRLPSTCIFKGVKGPTGYAKRNIMADNLISAFSLIIDNYIIKHIKKCTEEEGRRILRNDWTTTLPEIRAFIGILYARGAYEAKNLKLSYLWSAKWGPEFFRKTMTREKFKQILRFIRFDKRTERSRHLQTNKFALVLEIWDKFIENSQACYQPGQNITVDEQLFPSKARCRFTQSMPNKPNKFGIKFWLASDVSSKYVLNGFPYLGKDEKQPSSMLLSEHVVLKLVEPYTGCGRNITTNNFFTSMSLATKLLAKQTTLVGTIRGNKRELPKAAKQTKDNMPPFSTLLYKSENCVLTIYKSKPNKRVAVLSSKHKFVKIDKSNKKMLPESIQFYNSTKFGVDMADQMARKYTVKASSCRWPLQIFFNILDLAAINAWILYKETTGIQIQRKEFLFQLAEQLSTEYRAARQKNSSEHEDPQRSTATSSNATHSNKRKICQVQLCHNNKTNNICEKCQKYVCGRCIHKKISTFICIKCTNNNA
ncbi:piggyBac transposable element-derived protein 4-like [Myotis daubentonii]|uniref:piggyBac transposable element-derived protein 4-like n=1 Tax=Myotis daubentonii TaxID=98922 RepID=UPI00287347BA|nr:piggyBac transposable element-derived protein 4-like [Myotis daubentonii]